ncbi:hypothetical protein ACQRBN_13310 [Bariatricus sp. SGI.154]|uniref:hypothetical protein n=1 Tax=Bariatricus sp. SGI.154 TaxID=3420549 RepID=UPI003D08509C
MWSVRQKGTVWQFISDSNRLQFVGSKEVWNQESNVIVEENLKDFSDSDILEFCACGTEFILISDLFFTNGLYGSSTDMNCHTAPLCLTFLCVTLHELWGFLTRCNGNGIGRK